MVSLATPSPTWEGELFELREKNKRTGNIDIYRDRQMLRDRKRGARKTNKEKVGEIYRYI